MKPIIQLCVEYSNGYSVTRDMGERVDIEELAGYLEVAKTMVPDQPVTMTIVRIEYREEGPHMRRTDFAIAGPSE